MEDVSLAQGAYAMLATQVCDTFSPLKGLCDKGIKLQSNLWDEQLIRRRAIFCIAFAYGANFECENTAKFCLC